MIDTDTALPNRCSAARPRLRRLGAVVALALLCGCATIRITDPYTTADELYLENVASQLAVDKLSTAVLRDRKVYIQSTYLTAAVTPSDEQQYMIGELRAKLLLGGVRLVDNRKDADIVLELRSQGISIDHLEFLLGINSTNIGGIISGGITASTPEIAIIKRTTQEGYSSIAYIAYWANTGEVVASSGPFVGRTKRVDYWFFGYGPETSGNIPPAEQEPTQTNTQSAGGGGTPSNAQGH